MVRQWDNGTPIIVEIQNTGLYQSVTGHGLAQYIFLRPDSTVLTVNATGFMDASDSNKVKLKYITTSGDLNIVGRWHIQAIVNLPSPSGTWRTEEAAFYVERALD